LADLLRDEATLTLLIAGRSLDKARAFCDRRQCAAKLAPVQFDRENFQPAELQTLQPDVVVEASGPFQAYGDYPYRLARACVDTGIHYLDLADGSEFVLGIERLDRSAKAAGVFVLSGCSSFPVLTAAVTKILAEGMLGVRSIHAGIAPSPYAGVGLNVIRAISTYAGKPLALRRNGRSISGYPFTDGRHVAISPPGELPLRRRRFTLVDVPDLQLMPRLWPEAQTVWLGVGPVPEILQLGLSALAWLVRLRVLPSLLPLARLFHWTSNHIRWGEYRGGMFLAVTGTDGISRSWHMIAEADAGPLIPSMAAEGVIRRMMAGDVPPPGARPATGELQMSNYETLFRGHAIHYGIRDHVDAQAPLFHRVLGPVWDRLPEVLKAGHRAPLVLRGEAHIERGKGLLARFAGWLFRFPSEGSDMPTSVAMAVEGPGEAWTRQMGKNRFTSHLSAGKGRDEHLLVERFGPLSFGIALVWRDERLKYIVRQWKAFGIPMPPFLAPGGDSYETVIDGRFHFSVEIRHILTGPIVRYSGWLKPSEATT
jgi:hypothetical protein